MSQELFDLTGKVALVTGGTHGIGMACGKALAKAGANTVLAAKTPAKIVFFIGRSLFFFLAPSTQKKRNLAEVFSNSGTLATETFIRQRGKR